MTRPDRTRAEVIAVYLVRHGESAYNSEGRIQGQHDPPLTELGLRQAELVAGRLAEEKFDAVYSSDLVRARATAEVIAAGLGLSCETTPLLREARLGVIEGLTRAEVESKYQSSLHKWRVEPLAARPPGAESIEQVIDRARVFLDEVLSRHSAGSKLLVVAHGGSIRGVIIAGLGLPTHVYRQLHFSNGSLSVIELGNDPGIRLLNDTCHLGSSRSDGEEI